MTDAIRFTLDGDAVEARDGETIWDVSKRLGNTLPHLCHLDKPGYRPDGNCRACVVHVDGERALTASCIRKPTPGMTVSTGSERATKARKMVLELLLADQPETRIAHDPDSLFFHWVREAGLTTSRFPAHDRPLPDSSHPAMAVNRDACIHCTLCVRACREVQVNDVIGMANRSGHTRIVFDMDDPMGDSTCVACGECVQACPTGALMPASVLDAAGVHTGPPEKSVESLCPYCGVGCQLTYHVAGNRIRPATAAGTLIHRLLEMLLVCQDKGVVELLGQLFPQAHRAGVLGSGLDPVIDRYAFAPIDHQTRFAQPGQVCRYPWLRQASDLCKLGDREFLAFE